MITSRLLSEESPPESLLTTADSILCQGAHLKKEAVTRLERPIPSSGYMVRRIHILLLSPRSSLRPFVARLQPSEAVGHDSHVLHSHQPSNSPPNPPGAAPTLTTVYDEADGAHPSPSASPNNFLSEEPPNTAAKQGSKRKSRLGLFAKPAPASAVVKGTNKEIKRVQGIADSLDLEADLSADLEPARSDGLRMEVEKRRGTVVGVEEPNRIVSGGDARLDVEEETRASIGVGLQGGKRRCSIG